MTEADPARDWKPRWPLPHSSVDMPGHHDTVLTDHAETTSEAIGAWVDQSFRGELDAGGPIVR